MVYLVALLLPATAEQLLAAAEVGEFDVAPDTGAVVFCWDRLGDQDLYRVSSAGGKPELLVGEPGHESAPSFSPAGDWIAFDGTVSRGDGDVFVVSASGGEPRNVSSSPGRDHLLGWATPEQLLIRSERGGRGFDLYLLDLSSGQARRLTKEGGVLTGGVSPRGGGVVVRREGRVARLRAIDLETGRLSDGPELVGAREGPEWLSRVHRFGVSGFRGGLGRLGVWVRGARNLDWRHGFGSEEFGLRAVPASDRVAFLRRFRGDVEVLTSTVGLEQSRPVATQPGSTRRLRWSRGGAKLVFDRANGILPRSLYVASMGADGQASVRGLVRGSSGLDPSALVAPRREVIPLAGREMGAGVYSRKPRAGRAVILVVGTPGQPVENEFRPVAQALALSGITVVIPEHAGSLPTAQWPDRAIEDLKATSEWMIREAHAAPGRVGVVGQGWFGGYLALMVAARFPEQVRGVVSLGGVTDLRRFWRDAPAGTRDLLELTSVSRKESDWLADSPSSYVTRLKAALLVYAQHDETLPGARSLVSALRGSGAAVRLIEHSSHDDPLVNRRQAADALRGIAVFLNDRL